MTCIFAECAAPATFVVAALLGGLIYRCSPARRLLCCGTGLMVATLFGIAVTHALFHSFFAYSTVQAHTMPLVKDSVPPAAAKAEPIAKDIFPGQYIDFVADVWRNQYGKVDTRITDVKFKDQMVMMGYGNGIVTPVLCMLVYLAYLCGMRMAVPMQLLTSVWICGISFWWFGTEVMAGLPHVAAANHQKFFAMAAIPVIAPVMLLLTSLFTLCCCPVGKKEKDESAKKSTKKTQ